MARHPSRSGFHESVESASPEPTSTGPKQKTFHQRIASRFANPASIPQGVGPKRAEELEKFGLKSVEDLLYHLPFRYDDRRQIKKISDAAIGQDENFVGEIRGLQKKYNPRRRAQLIVGSLVDGTGTLGLLWYRAPAYLSNSLARGQRLLVHGVSGTGAQRTKADRPSRVRGNGR